MSRIRSNHENKTKMGEYKQKLAEAEAVAQGKRAQVEAAIVRAKEWSEEKVESRKKVDSLKKEIVKLEESLKRQAETQESREVVTAEYQRLKEVFARADNQVRLYLYLNTIIEIFVFALSLDKVDHVFCPG